MAIVTLFALGVTAAICFVLQKTLWKIFLSSKTQNSDSHECQECSLRQNHTKAALGSINGTYQQKIILEPLKDKCEFQNFIVQPKSPENVGLNAWDSNSPWIIINQTSEEERCNSAHECAQAKVQSRVDKPQINAQSCSQNYKAESVSPTNVFNNIPDNEFSGNCAKKQVPKQNIWHPHRSQSLAKKDNKVTKMKMRKSFSLNEEPAKELSRRKRRSFFSKNKYFSKSIKEEGLPGGENSWPLKSQIGNRNMPSGLQSQCDCTELHTCSNSKQNKNQSFKTDSWSQTVDPDSDSLHSFSTRRHKLSKRHRNQVHRSLKRKALLQAPESRNVAQAKGPSQHSDSSVECVEERKEIEDQSKEPHLIQISDEKNMSPNNRLVSSQMKAMEVNADENLPESPGFLSALKSSFWSSVSPKHTFERNLMINLPPNSNHNILHSDTLKSSVDLTEQPSGEKKSPNIEENLNDCKLLMPPSNYPKWMVADDENISPEKLKTDLLKPPTIGALKAKSLSFSIAEQEVKPKVGYQNSMSPSWQKRMGTSTPCSSTVPYCFSHHIYPDLYADCTEEHVSLPSPTSVSWIQSMLGRLNSYYYSAPHLMAASEVGSTRIKEDGNRDPEDFPENHERSTSRHCLIRAWTPMNESGPSESAEEMLQRQKIRPINVEQFVRKGRTATLPLGSMPPDRKYLPQQMSLNLANDQLPVNTLERKDEKSSLGELEPDLYLTPGPERSDGTQSSVNHGPGGDLTFSLRYNQSSEVLQVGVIRARGLPPKDFSGSSDPYVKVCLLPDRKVKYQTRVHKKSLNPDFNESFAFQNLPFKELPNRMLQFTVYDFDRFSRHDFIGRIVIRDIVEKAGNALITQEGFVTTQDLRTADEEKDELGEVMLTLCYLPTAGRLTVTVVKAMNLRAMDITGSSDPYVKISLMHCGKRVRKRKTTVKKSTLNPVFNEALVFDTPPEQVSRNSLLVQVIDYDRIGHSELIGVVELGNNASSVRGQTHWKQMMANHRTPVSFWHPLMASPSTTISPQKTDKTKAE